MTLEAVYFGLCPLSGYCATMKQWRLDEDTILRPVRPADAAGLFACVERNRERLRPWMWWVDETRTIKDVAKFIAGSRAQPDGRPAALECALVVAGTVQGAVGLNRISWTHRHANAGYWIDGAHESRGLVTRACRELFDHAFRDWRLERVAIHVATENRRSHAVADRLGAVREGILRHAELVDGRFLDMAVYGILADDWLGSA